jgi:ABC-type transport system involved in Fe-S cluster assembly fused permease/ATPase subunit
MLQTHAATMSCAALLGGQQTSLLLVAKVVMELTGAQVMRVLDRGTSAIQNILSTVVFAIGPQVLPHVPRLCLALRSCAWVHTVGHHVALPFGHLAECASSHSADN